MYNYSREASVSNMITQLKWRSLEQRRADMRLILLYKIKKNLIAVDFRHQLIPPTRLTRHQHPLSLRVPSETKLYIQQSFLPRTIEQWNNLSAAAVTMPTLEGFKSAVRVLTHWDCTFSCLLLISFLHFFITFLSAFIPLSIWFYCFFLHGQLILFYSHETFCIYHLREIYLNVQNNYDIKRVFFMIFPS